MSPETTLETGLSAFLRFVQLGKTKEMLLCIKQGIEITHMTPDTFAKFPKANALHLAAAMNRDVICQVLLETGVFDVNQKDKLD